MIMLTASLQATLRPLRFVGHGGDDFVVLFRSPYRAERVQRIIAEFNEQATAPCTTWAARMAGIEAEDRYGVPRFFPSSRWVSVR